jgi:hypothetical protein
VRGILARQFVGHRVGGFARDRASLASHFPGALTQKFLLGPADRQAGGAERHAQRRHEDRLFLRELLKPAATLLD